MFPDKRLFICIYVEIMFISDATFRKQNK